MTLERELAVYNDFLPSWLAEGRKGQWVAIWNGNWVLGHFATVNDALDAGYSHSLPEAARTGQPERPFLVRQITDGTEPVPFFSRCVTGELEARDARVRTEEREACARLCEQLADDESMTADDWTERKSAARIAAYRRAAALIRERKE